MNRTRRSNHRRSNRKRGGASISPAPVTYSTVSANPQPSERVMQWATTARAPTPSGAEMQGVAHGGKRSRRTRRTRRHKSHHCRRKSHRYCRHK